jgi:hypothetical protein
MDPALVSALVDAVIGQVQAAVEGKMLRTETAAGASAVQLIDAAAQQNVNSLVNVAAGVGTNVNKTI